jgi:hypothetical protein
MGLKMGVRVLGGYGDVVLGVGWNRAIWSDHERPFN